MSNAEGTGAGTPSVQSVNSSAAQTAPLLVDHVSPARAAAPLRRVAADRRAVAAVRATACLAGAVAAGVLAHAAPMNVMHSGDIPTVTPLRHTAALRHRPG